MAHSLHFKACVLSCCASQGMMAVAFICARRLEVGYFLLLGSFVGAAAVLRGWPMARSLRWLELEGGGL